MKKIFYVTISITILLVSFLGITYSYEYDREDSLSFKLIGPTTLYIDINTEYIEYGIEIIYNGIDISDRVVIDSSSVDTSTFGEYNVKYEVNIDGNIQYVYRKVKVIDKSNPEIKLNGGDSVYILLNGNYVEYGYTVTDNYDMDLEDKVIVEGSVDTSKEGTYEIKYSVIDSSGNRGETIRKVIVKKPVITVDKETANRVALNSYNVTNYSNTIVKNNFNDNGIYYEGYVRDKASIYKMKLKNRNNSLEYLYNMVVSKDNYYSGSLDLTLVANGTYDVYIIGNKEEKLLNKMNILSKLVRAKVGNKLVSLVYNDDFVSIMVEDFAYQYDVVIDPGHGGNGDNGSSNGIMQEKDMNLKVSKYEKCRYESMGYRVYMVRYDDSYGEMLGPSNLDRLDRRALTIGYYGAVSKVVYSNHHNGSTNALNHGFEIIVANQATVDNLVVERSLYNKFRGFYGINDNSKRFYSKNYDTEEVYSKVNGDVYGYKNYYSVIRIPLELYNVYNTIYEPIYLTNSSDFNWYWSNNNWIKITEAKIEAYVNYMGGTYNSDNSKCL